MELQDKPHLDNRLFMITVIILTVMVIADLTVIKVYIFNRTELLSIWRTILFTIIVASFFVTNYFIIIFLNRRFVPTLVVQKRQIAIVKNLTIGVQIFLASLLIFVIAQLVTMSYYLVISMILASTISHMLAASIMVALTKQFFNWYKLNRNLTVLFYSIATLALTVNLILGVVSIDLILLNKPTKIYSHVGAFVPYVERGSPEAILNDAYSISTIFAFIMTWIATASLLYHYSYKLGKLKYWLLLGLPLIYFSSQFVTSFIDLFQLVTVNYTFYGVFFNLLFSLSKTCGGILFGIAFLTLYRIVKDNTVKRYMLLSSTGLILFFAANQATTVVASPSYPPFGLVSISSIGLASFLMFIGIYSSAVSIGQDTQLRKDLVKHARKELKLLYSIGSSEMENELCNKTLVLLKKQQERMVAESGVESSLREEDVRIYVKRVMKEMGKTD
jgi:hypothetical protein